MKKGDDKNIEKMAMLGRMTRGIIHDFNNSLASILGNAEFLTSDLDPESDQYVFAQNIRKAGFQLQDIIDQIRAISAEKNAGKDIALNLVDEVQTLSERLQSKLLPAQDISFSTDLADATLSLPPHQFRTLIRNVIENGIDALGGLAGKIEVHVSAAGQQQISRIYDHKIDIIPAPETGLNRVEIRVIDTGNGMDMSVLEMAAAPRFTTKNQDQSHGLGLTVAHEIIRHLGGGLSIASTQQDGTEVTIVLPVESITTKSSPPNGHEKKKFLLVDDRQSVLQTIAIMLTREQHKVDWVDDSATALDMIREKPSAYDVLITDFEMPYINGKDLIADIRQDFKTLPIILMSGDVETLDEVKREMSSDNVFVLAKPVTKMSLNRILESIATK